MKEVEIEVFDRAHICRGCKSGLIASDERAAHLDRKGRELLGDERASSDDFAYCNSINGRFVLLYY